MQVPTAPMAKYTIAATGPSVPSTFTRRGLWLRTVASDPALDRDVVALEGVIVEHASHRRGEPGPRLISCRAATRLRQYHVAGAPRV